MNFTDVALSVDESMARERDPAAFFEVARPAFQKVLDEGLHVSALNALLVRIRDEHLPITARHTSGRFIILHSSPLGSWALVFHDEPSKYLYLSPVHVLQSNIGSATSLRVERYQCTAPSDFSRLDPAVELSFLREESCRPGEILERSGLTEVLDWRRSRVDRSAAVSLRLNSLALAPFVWAFERSSSKPVGLSPVEGLESNLSTLLTLLAVCGNGRTVELLEPLLHHERHFVRWAVARTIAALDADAGRRAASSLVNDVHPEVRAASKRALSHAGVPAEFAA